MGVDNLPSPLSGSGLAGGDLGESTGGGPTPSSSELLDGLLPRVKLLLLLLLLKYSPLFCNSIMCCWAAKLLKCFNCEATVEFVFVLNLDIVKSNGWSAVSCADNNVVTWVGGWWSNIGISSFLIRFQQNADGEKSIVLLFKLLFLIDFGVSKLLFWGWVTGWTLPTSALCHFLNPPDSLISFKTTVFDHKNIFAKHTIWYQYVNILKTKKNKTR